ncbi:MAG: type II toxin-antitoxin system VapC family toxin [Deltaproteobacteria bacterium]|nr:type II toxin-antitoxin system VapC family toxin [Deltaproteobacteria bacterium]
MKFWDSSAIVPLLVEEPASSRCRALLRDDPAMAAWALARTEAVSAVRRKERAGELTREATAAALRRGRALAEAWTEVDALGPVRDRAERVLAVHVLRAADALQLAAALLLVQERPEGWPFVTLDDRLAAAAAAEGFEVIVPAP